jgi:8-oxo-dGTP diphosphatase
VTSRPVVVVGVAVVRHGRVLAARRTGPADAKGGWELPGGKLEAGESLEEAAVREVHEELGCTVRPTSRLTGQEPIGRGHVLQVTVADLVDGDPAPHEHDTVRWLQPEELGDVTWLPADRPFLPELREVLLDGHRLEGGNVGGAVRIGRTVRRATGPWTPAVHRLLGHLRAGGLRAVPEPLGEDARGREVLSYLPGRVVDVDTEALTDGQLASLAAWARDLHEAVADASTDGPWRFWKVDHPSVLGHNDLAPYNACFAGDRLVGVFDWDLAGPSTALLELAHLAWNGVPLFRAVPAEVAARRLETIATSYGAGTGRDILAAVPARVRLAVDGIRAAVTAGDEQMRNLTLLGEPERTEQALTGLLGRMPAIETLLSQAGRGRV